jgi:hypothetical protein
MGQDGYLMGNFLSEDEMINFRYLQAVYCLNTFYGHSIKPHGNLETRNEKICREVIERGGDIVEMYKSGADALYCALLSDPDPDERLLLKTVERYIPF